MPNYLEPEDDGLPIREFGPWVTEKLDYLNRYIEIFENSMRAKPWRRRHYIDLFSGSGKCRLSTTGVVHLGSPLIALRCTHPFTDYFFVDSNPENITALQERCDSSPVHDRVECKVDDGNVIVTEVADRILSVDREFHRGTWSSLNLAFLDPDGLELHWETVATLAKVKRMDLIIHYSQMGLTRNMGQWFQSDTDTPADKFFGGRDWRRIFEKYQNRQIQFIHRKLMDHYKEKLQDLGYQEVFRDDEVGDEPLIRNARTNAPLYRLLFVSKSPLGQKFWREVTRRNVQGQAHLPSL